MVAIKPYTIAVPDASLKRLHQKLELADLPKYQIEGAEWTYGTPLKDIQRLVESWKTKFDWRAKEKELNALPNFMTEITVDGFDPIDIHFVHQISDVDGAIPYFSLMDGPEAFGGHQDVAFVEGGNGKPAFHVVAPSLPNYAFSGGVNKKGFELAHYAEALNKLMLALGYDEYVTQGGDWGFMTSQSLAWPSLPKNVKGSHFNWAFASPPKWTESNPEPEYSAREKTALGRGQDWWAGDGRGYLAIQSTKPATIGFAFADSPIAVLAWIYEKMVGWTDSYPWTDEEVLTWVSLYYFSTAGPEASSYHYYEALHGSIINTPVVQGYIDIPLGLADFPVEIMNAPKAWWGTLGPVVYSKSFDKGGHFAGWERPEDVAEGLCEMFGKEGGAAGVVAGKTGY